MQTSQRLFVIGMVGLILVASGCSRWKEESADGPLNGPGSQSPTFLRQRLEPEGWFDERAWSHRSGSKVKVYSVAKRVDSYCERLPEYSRWTPLQASIDGKQLRFAPAKFWIVSIDPIAVIMTPYSVSNPDSHSLRELSGATDRRALVSSVLANSYSFGTQIDTSASLQWFVVSESGGISAQRFDEDQLTLTNADLILTLTKGKDGITRVERAAK